MNWYRNLVGITPLIYFIFCMVFANFIKPDKEKKIRYVVKWKYLVISGFIAILYIIAVILTIFYDDNNKQLITDLLIKDNKIEYKVKPVSGETYISLKDSTMKNSYKFIKNIK